MSNIERQKSFTSLEQTFDPAKLDQEIEKRIKQIVPLGGNGTHPDVDFKKLTSQQKSKIRA